MFFFDLQRSFEFTEYTWTENFLSEREIQEVFRLGEQGEWRDAQVYSAHQTQSNDSYRKASLCSLMPDPQTQWLYEKLGKVATQCNRAKYHFDLTGILEPIAITRYHVGNHFEWHKDHGSGEISIRKISLVVQLSASEDYEGGDLEFFGDKEHVPAMRKRGTAILFPSFIYHRVTPVTAGERYSLVCWVSGPPYR